MADDWIGINSSHLLAGGVGVGFCGEEVGRLLADALDGLDEWRHITNEVHWFILDLGDSYTIKQVRGKSDSGDDPIDVDIFVSDDMENWGAAVAEGISTWQDGGDWDNPIDVTDKDGRYIKIVINNTEDTARVITFGDTGPSYPIFDAYGEVIVPSAVGRSFGFVIG